MDEDTINNLISMLNSQKNNTSNDETDKNTNTFNSNSIDFETIMKFKNIMDKMNSKDDSRSQLLISLKPYLKESRKNKIDQYIQFLNMAKVFEIFSKSSGDGNI